MSPKNRPTNRRLAKKPAPVEAESEHLVDDMGDEAKAAAKDKKSKERAKRRAAQKESAKKVLGKAWSYTKLGVAVTIVVGVGVLLVVGIQRYLHHSPRFSVRSIVLDGNQRRSGEELASKAGIKKGVNLFDLDVQKAQAAIVADPWIESATVRKEMPSTVFIQVREHEPRAVVTIRDKLYLVDTQGRIFKTVGGGDQDDLPVITGLDAGMLTRDRAGVELRLRRVLDLCELLQDTGLAKRYPIEELRLATDDSITVIVTQKAIALEFGRAPFRDKVAKAQRILSELRHRRVTPTRIFLNNVAHPERVVVRMR